MLMKSDEVRGKSEGAGLKRHAHLRPAQPLEARAAVVEQDEEKEQMPLLLQVSPFVTLHLRSRELHESFGTRIPRISLAARHFDAFLRN